MASRATSATVNDSSVKPVLWVCYEKKKAKCVNSEGIFLGDEPLEFSVPLLLLELSIIMLASRATHYVLRHLGQSRTVSNIITGIILGPSVIGRSTKFQRAVFPARGTFVLDTLSWVSLILFLFIISVKMDLSLLRKPEKMAVAIGILSSVPPFLVCMAISLGFQNSFPPEIRKSKLLILLASRLSLTSFAVLADILNELKMLNSELGRLSMSTALVSDVASWLLSAIYVATDNTNVLSGVLSVVSLIAFALAVVFLARPMVMWIIRKTPVGELLHEGYFVGVVLLALFSAFVSEVIGYHSTFGPVMLGLVLPGGMPLGVTLSERLDAFVSGSFVPLYLVLAGYRTNFSKLNNPGTWGYLELIIVICYLGKLLGTMLIPLHAKKMPFRDALSLGLMMNLKGVVEISFLNTWGDQMVANAEHYSVMIVSMVLITATATPLIKYLYKPSMRFVVHKRRTIRHSKPNSQLRVLACIHNDDNVAAIIDLLEASSATRESPVCVIVLHLMELAGRAASVLVPYRRNKKSHNATPSDHIVNAFRYFEQQKQAVTVQPYVAIAPYGTMHNDVCSLARDKKAHLIILPFHKLSDGALATTRHALQSLNQKVLDYAPCSVAILVDKGLVGGVTCTHTNNLLNRVAVYFLGGADDREALAYGMHMARNPNLTLTVVRFVPKDEVEEELSEEGKLDDELVSELRTRNTDNFLYKEELVHDGEGTVGIIRSMSEKFDLLIVGRRKGMESALTTGLSVWSECAELGLVGDMLASMDFGGKVSILVVQQQERLVDLEEQAKGRKGIMLRTWNSITNRKEVKDAFINRKNQNLG